MADPLTSLKDYHMAKKEIIEKDGQIIFGGVSFPKDTKTNYLKFGFKEEDDNKEHYTLECLLFLLKNTEVKHPEYVRLAKKNSVPYINRRDRKRLLEFLNGDISSCNSIDKSVLMEKAQAKKPMEDDDNGSLTKKRKIETQERNNS